MTDIEQGVAAAELRALIARATDEDLTDGGRYFTESCDDLTQCSHQETGNYQREADGKLVEFLWNNRRRFLDFLEEPTQVIEAAGAAEYCGEDCPKGMVQVAFVGCRPKDRVGNYKWKPCRHAFVDIYVDGQRFNIQIGDFESARGATKRRGMHIIGPAGMGVDQHSWNACDLTLEDDGLGNTLKARSRVEGRASTT